MTIWLIVPNVHKLDEQKIRRLIEAVKKSKWNYAVDFAFVWKIEDIGSMQKNWLIDVFEEYADNDIKFHLFWKNCDDIEENIKQAMMNMMNDHFCVMDPDVVMFQTFFHRMIAWFKDEEHDVWMICPRFTIGDVAYDGGVYFKPWQIIYMIDNLSVEQYLWKWKEKFMKDRVVKVLRNCVCHYYGQIDDDMKSDNLYCDLII